MLTEERLSEIRALTWEWQYENCSDHQAAVDDLLRERDALAAEVERLREALEEQIRECRATNGYRSDCRPHFGDGEVGPRCWCYPCKGVQVLAQPRGGSHE